MKEIFYTFFRIVTVLVLASIVTACGEQEHADITESLSQDESAQQLASPELVAPQEVEPVDEQFTQELQASLDKQILGLSELQRDSEEMDQTAALEELTELDREALIDETAEEGSEQVKEDADKLIKILEDIAAQNE